MSKYKQLNWNRRTYRWCANVIFYPNPLKLYKRRRKLKMAAGRRSELRPHFDFDVKWIFEFKWRNVYKSHPAHSTHFIDWAQAEKNPGRTLHQYTLCLWWLLLLTYIKSVDQTRIRFQYVHQWFMLFMLDIWPWFLLG